jgi:hypothetical protein
MEGMLSTSMKDRHQTHRMTTTSPPERTEFSGGGGIKRVIAARGLTGRKTKKRGVTFVHAISKGKLEAFIDSFNKYRELTSDPLIKTTMRLWAYLVNLARAKNLYRTPAKLRIWQRLFQIRLNEYVNNMTILARKRIEGESAVRNLAAAAAQPQPPPPSIPLTSNNLAHAPPENVLEVAAEAADMNDLLERTREEVDEDLAEQVSVEADVQQPEENVEQKEEEPEPEEEGAPLMPPAEERPVEPHSKRTGTQ